ncbi:hypothetical protein J3R30DRAFT_3711809 [Lentinula aciculospora]|uniref:Tat pathway signal sequence n=1 Tax=Lentinula aciculospora TaxID=153920 RepID=A0A9W9DI48_9AGAR|nr:hypothetical protein J3R30DRAFT_3711809 [Lentinula aciculospora]
MQFSSSRLFSLLSWQASGKPSRGTTTYAPLVADPDRGDDVLLAHNQFKQSNQHALKKLIASGLIFLVGILLGNAVGRIPQKEIIQCNVASAESETLLYCTQVLIRQVIDSHVNRSILIPLFPAPAQDAVQYEVRRFNASFRTDITKYQGTPTEEIDKNWEDLYRYGVNQIPASEANKLVDKTVPIPGDEDNYIVTLEVFHQLHCLNLLRKSLYPDHYPTSLVNHLDHCIDILRQALTCTVDINPLSWYWYEPRKATETKLDGAHKCIDFEKIQEWAYEHRLQTVFDDSVNIQLGHGDHEHHDV